MLLTAAQRNTFLEEDPQMGITDVTVVQLQSEGIAGVEDLSNFDKETINQIAANLRHPKGRVADPNLGAASGATITTTTCVLGSKPQYRLIHYTKLIQYYDTVFHTANAESIQWTPIMKNLSEH